MGLLGEPVPIQPDDPLATYYQDEYLRQLYITSQNLSLKQREGPMLNNDKAGNFNAKYVIFTSNGTIDTEDSISHQLGTIPSGYIVVKQDKAGSLYNSTTDWTSTHLYLKSSVASITWTLLVF